MTVNASRADIIAADIAVFADIGTDPPSVQETAGGSVVRFVRLGENTELSLSEHESTLLTLIADRDTRLPDSFPYPTRVQDVSSSGKTLSSPVEVQQWVAAHLSNPPEDEEGLVPDKFRDHEAIKLLLKACRLRQYWLRRGDDMYAARILDNPFWHIVEKALAENDLLRVETRQASGTDARFIHVRQAEDILSENPANSDVRKMYASLISELREVA